MSVRMDVYVRLSHNSIHRYQNYITENATNDLLDSIKPVSISFHFMMHIQNKVANMKGRNFYTILIEMNDFWVALFRVCAGAYSLRA